MSAHSSTEAHTEDLMDGLVRTSFAVMAILSRTATTHDLSLTQLRVLAILRDREPKMADLASYLGLDRSSVSGLIDRAVTRGLVRRLASPDDGRAVRVSFTHDGRQLANQVAEEIGTLIFPMTDSLGAVEQKQLGELLSKVLG